MKLKLENGSFGYGKKEQILKNINFEVHTGEILAILGPNGAGKTTLLRCMMGMLRWNDGRCLLDGEDLAGMSQEQLWQKMAYVPQAKNVSSAYTALEMVLLGRSSRMRLFQTPKEEDVESAVRVMELLGISHLADRKCSEVSGGELQMILIARALVGEPKILILDEPESNLDFKNQLVVLNTMSALAKGGMICIFNTHYPAHALQRAGKALILFKDGDYVFGETKTTVTEQRIRKAFGVEAVITEVSVDEEQVLANVLPLRIAPDPEEGK